MTPARAAQIGHIRNTCFERERHTCAACRAALAMELDHFRGKARAESVETCWALCRPCHREKTDNKPSRIHWLTLYARHCAIHRYTEALKWALDEISWCSTKAKLSDSKKEAR